MNYDDLMRAWKEAPLPLSPTDAQLFVDHPDPHAMLFTAAVDCFEKLWDARSATGDQKALAQAVGVYREYGNWAWRIDIAVKMEEDRDWEDSEAKDDWRASSPARWWLGFLNQVHGIAVFTIAKACQAHGIDTASIELSSVYCREVYRDHFAEIAAKAYEGHYGVLSWPDVIAHVPHGLTPSQLDVVRLALIRLQRLMFESGWEQPPDILRNGIPGRLPNQLQPIKFDQQFEPSLMHDADADEASQSFTLEEIDRVQAALAEVESQGISKSKSKRAFKIAEMNYQKGYAILRHLNELKRADRRQVSQNGRYAGSEPVPEPPAPE